MGKFLLVGCALLVLFNVCLGSQDRKQQFQRGNECQIDRLTALEPTRRIVAEGGVTEFWDSSAQEFKCAGVTVVRRTIQPKGLLLPSYTNAPELVYTLQGRAIVGLLIPGCPETFESGSQQSWERQEGSDDERSRRSQDRRQDESDDERSRRSQDRRQDESDDERSRRSQDRRQDESDDERSRRSQDRRQEGSDDRQSRRFQDRHQKVRRLRQGDVAAVPGGVAHWVYNDGDEPLVDIILVDTSNSLNQLDQGVARRFYLAGRPEQESGHHQQKGQSQQRKVGNVLGGFATRFIAEAFGVGEKTARKLQCEQDERGNIILIQEGLQVISPPRRVHEREQRQSRDDSNGIEELYCSARIIENLDDPERADVYSTGAGRISTLNSFNLPILKQLKLSAEKGILYRDAIFAPHYSLNAHDIIYAVNGRAHIQVVDDQGNRVFDGELSKGQLLVIPQNFAGLKKAREDGFEWISFKTSENAMFQTLAGRTSAIRAMPVEVVSNIYQIPREQAQRLKYSRSETTLFRSQGRALDA